MSFSAIEERGYYRRRRIHQLPNKALPIRIGKVGAPDDAVGVFQTTGERVRVATDKSV
jgi:hypothetical protein